MLRTKGFSKSPMAHNPYKQNQQSNCSRLQIFDKSTKCTQNYGSAIANFDLMEYQSLEMRHEHSVFNFVMIIT